MAGYMPVDRELGANAVQTDAGLALVSLSGVVYTGPGVGGAMPKRQPVGAIVDGYIIEPTTWPTFVAGFAAVLDPEGRPITGVTKGVVEVRYL